MMRVEGINMIRNLKDKVFGVIVLTLFSTIGVSGFYCLYELLSMLYTKLVEKFGNIFIEIILLIIPVILSMILSGIFAYILYVGIVVFIGCCFEEKGVKNEKSI